MHTSYNKLTCEQARQLDLVAYLTKLGFVPDKISNQDYWFKSPLRSEKTASFKVNRRKNLWYDHGTGIGGTLIDFGILYHNCTIRELLEKLDGNFSFHQPIVVCQQRSSSVSDLRLISEKPIVSFSLLHYLKQRRINESVAKQYCREISFLMNGKSYVAIGFRNDQGGVELRNKWFKGSVAPKAITRIENGSKTLSVFEGFFDFLSHQTIFLQQPIFNSDFLVLNSTAFFEKSREVMDQYDLVKLFLDRDKTGQNCAAMALSWGTKHQDESGLYKGYKDLNEWMQQVGKSRER